MRRYTDLAQKCPYMIYVVTRDFIAKGLPRFYGELTQYIQNEKECESSIIPLFHDMTEEEAHKVLSEELHYLMREILIIPKEYTENSSEWTSAIIMSLAEKTISEEL